MIINHKHLIKIQNLILLIYNFLNFLFDFKKNKIRVLVYHHIEKDNHNLFLRQLYYLKKQWKFITPKQFEEHISGKINLLGKNILLTFDDGFDSNLIIAKKILKKFNIKSIFFIPSDFVNIKSIKESRLFIKKNILDQDLPSDFNTVKNMSIHNLKTLMQDGHIIGAHTKTHANLGIIRDKKKLNDEMINSVKGLEKKLNTTIKHFAFTYGNYESMSEQSLKIAFQQYNYVYSGLRGNNYKNIKNQIIKRDAVYLKNGNELLSIFINGIIDMKYFFQILKLNKLIKSIKKKK